MMKKVSWPQVGATLSGLALVLLLAACGGPDATSAPPSSAYPGPGAAATSASSPVALVPTAAAATPAPGTAATRSAPYPPPAQTPAGAATPVAVATAAKTVAATAPPATAPPVVPTPIVLTAKSAKAVVGKAYDFELYTHCGIDFSVDFDASFWDLTSARPQTIGNPIQRGTITLVNATMAAFKYGNVTLDFKRHTGVKTIPYLCI